MKKIIVGISGREYAINIGAGILDKVASIINESGYINCAGRKAAIVTDSNVEPLYSERIVNALSKAGASPGVITIQAGEASKSRECLEAVYERFFAMEITRSDIVIALGGGVVGDLTGFAAATFLRGVSYVQIPTSLLAQVDSSVGGKVAINHSRGKNLIGTFYHPITVIADTECLKTLEKRFYSDGMAEVIKYGAAFDRELFEILERGDYNMPDIVARCCDIKRSLVERDEMDTGLRMKLNFGHTFAHAIELYYSFSKYTHGEAVSIGMIMACNYGEKTGITPPGMTDRLIALLSSFGLPICCDADRNELSRLMLSDKKRDRNSINLILADDIGSCCIYPIEVCALANENFEL